MSVKIRRGKADDADFLARVMMLASRGHLHRGVWDLIAGGSEENCLDYLRRLALAEPVSLCHHSSFIIAEDDGRPAAALCGFDPRAKTERWRPMKSLTTLSPTGFWPVFTA